VRQRTSRGTTTFEFQTPWLHEARSPGGRPIALSDLGNSERLVLAHAPDLRHVQALKKWFAYDGSRFVADATGEVKRRAKSTARNILLEASVMDDDKQRNQVIAHQIRSESERSIRAAMSLAESDERIALRLGDFDRDPLLLNVLNGTLDLRNCQLRPHSRDDLITKIAPVKFDPDATAPTWDQFLSEIMEGDHDRIKFLRRWAGYSLTGDTSEHKLLLAHGKGANGKSTFFEILRHIYGDYALQADFSTFLATKGGGVRNDIARLVGARMVCAIESDAGRRMSETVVKHLTGGDTVAARFLYLEHFEFVPTFKLWLATNHRPTIVGTDEAIWRRIALVPFNFFVPPEKRDRELKQKLISEAPGILNWALAGLRDWQAQGLAQPEAVTFATSDYRQHEDTLQHFIDANLIAEPDAEVRASDMYAAYRQWAEEQGEYVMKERDFSDALVSKNFTKRRGNQGMFWKNVKLVAV
jgi:putative DNA primase/helicase